MNKYLRYILGFLLLALILSAFYFSKLMLFLVSILFIIIASIEYRNMFKHKGIKLHPVLPEIIGILCSYIFIYSSSPDNQTLITPILVLGTVCSFILTVIKNQKPYLLTTLGTISTFLLIFCGLYITKFTYYYEKPDIFYFITIYFLAVLSGDWIASKIGPKFNKRKLCPKISPQKTVSGAISNLIITCIICLLLTKTLDFTLIQSILTGIIISVSAQFGDLAISTIKRDLDIKHSGGLFLEYGGILDRMDAFIFSAPCVYYYLFIINII